MIDGHQSQTGVFRADEEDLALTLRARSCITLISHAFSDPGVDEQLAGVVHQHGEQCEAAEVIGNQQADGQRLLTAGKGDRHAVVTGDAKESTPVPRDEHG